MQQDAFQFNLKQGNQETLIKGLTSCKCRLSSLSSWLKQSRLLQQRRSTHKHAVKSSTTSGRRPPLSPVDLQKDMLWFCYSLTNSVCCFQGWSQKNNNQKNPKHCPAFSLHRHSCSPLTQWWYQCCSALSRLPEMICRFYWLHLKIFTGCCSTTNPGLTCRLADPLRLFTHKRATGFCSMWIRTGSTVRRRPLSCRHSEEFCCREKLNFNKCSVTSRREQKLKRSVVVDHSQPVQHHCWTEQNLHGTLRKVLQKGIQGSGRKTTSHCVSKVAAWENNRPITAESKYLSEEETGLNTSRAEPGQNNAERQNHWPHTSIHRQYCVMTAGIVW